MWNKQPELFRCNLECHILPYYLIAFVAIKIWIDFTVLEFYCLKQAYHNLWAFKLLCLFSLSLAFWYLCWTLGNLSSLLSSNLQFSPLIYSPDREEPTSDFLRSLIIKFTLSFDDILSECSPGGILRSLSRVGKLYTSHTILYQKYFIFLRHFTSNFSLLLLFLF